MTINVQDRLKAIQEKRRSIQNRKVKISPYQEVAPGNRWLKHADSNIIFDKERGTFKVDLKKKEHTYLSYQEHNIDFSKPPQKTSIFLQNQESTEVIFEGFKSDNLNIELFLIQYSRGKKLAIDDIRINEKKGVNISKETDGIRFAIRVKGSGNFKIERLTVGSFSLWNRKSLIIENDYLLLNDNNWYIPKTNSVNYDVDERTFEINTIEDKNHLYIVHNEPNGNFSKIEQTGIRIENDTLSISFKGIKNQDLDVRLAIIFYSSNEKHSSIELNLNSKKLLSVPDEIDRFRLAIRVSGQGSFSINELVINNVGYWWSNEFSNSYNMVNIDSQNKYILDNKTLIGWKDSSNKLRYYPENGFFEAKMVGKQFVHLNYLMLDNELIKPIDKHYYTIYPTGQIFGDVKISLLLIDNKDKRNKIVQEIRFNEKSHIKFHEGIKSIRFMVKITGDGYFRNLEVNVDELPVKLTNSLSVDLSHNLWYPASKKMVKLSTEQDQLKGQADIEDGKNVYISYKESNNSFGNLPTSPLINIRENCEYEFYIRADVDESVEVIPMFIGYSPTEKIQVLQLKLNSHTNVKPQEGITQFRVALRISGKGNFNVSDFTVEEYESIENIKEINLIDKNEVDKLNLLPSKPLKELKLAVIFDEFTYASYKYECKLITFTPENWIEVLTREQPDILMVESAWNGNSGSWNKHVGYYGEENMKPLYTLINWCKENNIPTVFWNKEDPVHFNRFIETAKRFDYIYTTDENMIDSYKENAGHENVFALPFAAQPIIHNPIKIVDERQNKACFAGSYYRHHVERCIDMDRLLDSASKYGLDIYDRNYLMTQKGLMPNHKFPERFDPFIKGNLKYYEIDKAYKSYKVMINVNTVKDSPTMFSRRVFEGLASGTPVISTYAKGVENIFGELVDMSEDKKKLDASFKALLENESHYRKKAMIGIREVLTKHTYTNRLSYIVNNANLNFESSTPNVSVICFANSREEFNDLLNQFERQKYTNKKLVILIDTFNGYQELFNRYNNDEVQTFIRTYMHNYSNILEWIDTEYIAYFSNNDYYGKNYLTDLMLSTLYTDSDFIGKSNYFTRKGNKVVEQNSGKEYMFVENLMPACSIVKTVAFSKISLEELLNRLSNELSFPSNYKFGTRYFSSDKFNYLKDARSFYKSKNKKNIFNSIEI